MKLDGLKFLNTAQNLVFWKNENKPATDLIKDGEAIQTAEDLVQGEENQPAGCPVPTFVPYKASVPWHSGPRNLFSKFFPRYGNYCGPNWSSGREAGSLYWDKKPIDWLDYCCYKHDMGYDTYNQEDLYKADVAFFSCLQSIPESETKNLAGTYRSLYMLGLERFLVPYRQVLLKKLQDGKQGRETSPEVIVQEVEQKNEDIDSTS